jgi:hypothetical protein
MRRRRFFVLALAATLFAALAAPPALPPAAHADSKASSRIRDVEGRREVRVSLETHSALLDTLAARGTRNGYEVRELDREHEKLVLERAADVGEASLVRTPPDGTERVRVRFEIVRPKKSSDLVTLVGAIVLVSNPNSSGELMMDLGKRDPYRDQLKAWMTAFEEPKVPPSPPVSPAPVPTPKTR